MGLFIKLEGKKLESIFMASTNHGIKLKCVKRIAPKVMEAFIPKKHYKKLLDIANQQEVSINILKQTGSLRFYSIIHKQATLAISVLFCFILVYMFTSRLWFLRIDAIESDVSGIESLIRNYGFYEGIKKGTLDYGDLENAILAKFDNYGWVGIRSRGVSLDINAKKANPVPDIFDINEKVAIVASRDALIQEINAISGVAQVKVGDVVRAGQLLIYGEEKETRESMKRVAASGMVMGKSWYKASARTLIYDEKREYTGQVTRRRVLKFGEREVDLLHGALIQEAEISVDKLAVGGLFVPIWVETWEYKGYNAKKTPRDMDVCKKETENWATEIVIRKLPEDAIIIDKWIDYSMINSDVLECVVTLEITQNIAVEKRF